MKIQTVPEWKLKYIRVNHAEKTVSELVDELGISDSKIRSYLKEHNIKAKPSEFHKKNRKPGTVIIGHPHVPPYKKLVVKKERPPTMYSNTNYFEKYA